MANTSLLLCTEFEQDGSITGETAKQFRLLFYFFYFLDLQYLGWYFFISIYQVNMLSKVKILKPMYRRYIQGNINTTLFDYLNINQINKITTEKCQSSIINEFKKNKREYYQKKI